MVRGVQAQIAGNVAVAEQAFRAARLRDRGSLPRATSLPIITCEIGDAERGLPEIAVLARLVPGGADKVAPYVAAYAQDRANWPSLRTTFAPSRSSRRLA
jgi:hypothetical protein